MTHLDQLSRVGRSCAVVTLVVAGLACAPNMQVAVRGAASAHLALQAEGAGCDEWELHQLSADDIRDERPNMLDEEISKAEQRHLAERGVLFAATCPAWRCDPVAFVACVDGPESCQVLIDNFLPITCTPFFY